MGRKKMLNHDDLEIPDFLKRKKGEKPRVIVEEPIATPQTITVPQPKPTPEPEAPMQRANPQDGIRANVAELVAELEEEIDAFNLKGKSEFDPYAWMAKREVKAIHARYIADRYRPLLHELVQAETDPELKEAYRHLSKKELRAYQDFVRKIVDDAKAWHTNGKRKRAPRKTKPEKVVKKLKYKKEDIELKIVSIPPEKIVGATELWVVDTRYNSVAFYIALGGETLSVKGCTIKNFDPEKAKIKRVRKIKDFLPLLKTQTASHKAFAALKTKEGRATGRINGNVILLKVF